MSSLPIACSLTALDLTAVKEHYRAAASNYHATARISDDHASISLSGDKAALGALLAEMIERENACCPFLTFDITETDEGYDIRLRVLDAAGLERDILSELVAALFPTAALTVA